MRGLLAALILLCAQASAAALPPKSGAAEFAPGELLIVFHESARPSNPKSDPRLALHLKLGAELLERIPQIHVDRVRLPLGADEAALKAAYLADPAVRAVERNAVFNASSPNDAFYPTHAGWYEAIAARQAFDAWVAGSIVLGTQVKVAVIDTGVFAHGELTASGQLLAGASFHSGDLTSDDNNGHGTFVSGVIAAATSNTAGMAGVFFDASKVRILPVKVLGASGSGFATEIANGIIYAANEGAKVLNMSLGSTTDTITIENAINYAKKAGCFLVAAAGNDGGPVSFPAAYPNVFSVGALSVANARTSYSNYGRLDISAPGGDGDYGFDPPCSLSAASYTAEIWSLCNAAALYTYGAGTSFASPMVAAAAALLLSQDPSRSGEDLQRILIQTTDPTVDGPGWHAETGWGRLNVHRALSYGSGPASLPGTPLKVYNWPNPFNPDREGLTNFTFYLEQGGETLLRLFDLGGEVVMERRLSPSQTYAGMNILSWDGKNGAGAPAANGTYILVVTSGGRTGKNRVAVLR